MPGAANATCSPDKGMSCPLLLDEMFSDTIAQQLRAKGRDARTVVADPALVSLPDDQILAHATAARRALLTANIKDFMPLDAARRRLRRPGAARPRYGDHLDHPAAQGRRPLRPRAAPAGRRGRPRVKGARLPALAAIAATAAFTAIEVTRYRKTATVRAAASTRGAQPANSRA
jgi:hypothetical protein